MKSRNIRNQYDRVPEALKAFEPSDPTAPTRSGAERIQAMVDHQLRPRYGLDFFLRHLRHPGTLIIRTRPRFHPALDGRKRWSDIHNPATGQPRPRVLPGERSRRRIILAWRPHNELLPTAITTAYRTVIDGSMLVNGAKGTREVEVHLRNGDNGPVLVFPVLVWPPDLYRPHLRQRITTQVCIPRDQLGHIAIKAHPHPRIHPLPEGT